MKKRMTFSKKIIALLVCFFSITSMTYAVNTKVWFWWLYPFVYMEWENLKYKNWTTIATQQYSWTNWYIYDWSIYSYTTQGCANYWNWLLMPKWLSTNQAGYSLNNIVTPVWPCDNSLLSLNSWSYILKSEWFFPNNIWYIYDVVDEKIYINSSSNAIKGVYDITNLLNEYYSNQKINILDVKYDWWTAWNMFIYIQTPFIDKWRVWVYRVNTAWAYTVIDNISWHPAQNNINIWFFDITQWFIRKYAWAWKFTYLTWTQINKRWQSNDLINLTDAVWTSLYFSWNSIISRNLNINTVISSHTWNDIYLYRNAWVCYGYKWTTNSFISFWDCLTFINDPFPADPVAPVPPSTGWIDGFGILEDVLRWFEFKWNTQQDLWFCQWYGTGEKTLCNTCADKESKDLCNNCQIWLTPIEFGKVYWQCDLPSMTWEVNGDVNGVVGYGNGWVVFYKKDDIVSCNANFTNECPKEIDIRNATSYIGCRVSAVMDMYTSLWTIWSNFINILIFQNPKVDVNEVFTMWDVVFDPLTLEKSWSDRSLTTDKFIKDVFWLLDKAFFILILSFIFLMFKK